MPKYLIAFFMLAFLVGSCVTAPDSPTPPPTAPVKPTITASPAPSATATPALQTNEHLIVTRDLKHWAVLNADGSLQEYIETPDIASPSDVSPDGNWVNYEPGFDYDEPYDYSLNLFNLHDGTSQPVAKLISPDFPENIEPIVRSTFQYDQSFYGADCADLACRRSRVKDEVVDSAGLSSWSPDGKLLAFTAQSDGPSTDIYIYSMQDKSIRRLTDDLQNAGMVLQWSPDGKRILYTTLIPGVVGIDLEKETFHVTDLAGKSLQLSQEIVVNLYRPSMSGWMGNNLYWLQLKSRSVIVLNTETGEVTEILPPVDGELAIETENTRAIFSFRRRSDPIPDAPEPGTYFISPNGEREKISSQVFYPLIGSSQIIGTEKGVSYHILSDGSINRIDSTGSGWLDSSSPDKKWFFLDQGYDERRGQNLLSLYSSTYQKTRTWVLEGALTGLTWRPDSLGIFLFTKDNIYYLSIPDGEPQRLDVEVPMCSWEPLACASPLFDWRP